MESSWCCIETQQCSFAHGLRYTYCLVTQTVVTLGRCAVFRFVTVWPWNIVRDQTEFINYEARSMKRYGCMSVFLPWLCSMHSSSLHRRVVCGLCGCTLFFAPCLMNGSIFGKVIEHEMYALIFFKTAVWNISRSKKNSARCFHKCL